MARKRKSRRSPGDGSVWLRADTGRYQAALVVGWTVKGNARRISKSFDSRSEADAWLADMRRELHIGTRLDSTATVREAFDDWIETGETVTGWAPATSDNYKRVLEKHALPVLGKVRVRDVTTAAVRSLIRDLIKSGVSPAMAKRVRTYLSILFIDAMRAGLITVNPVTNVPTPDVEEPEIQRWSEDEISAIVRECLSRGDQASRYVLVGVATGMRTEELLGLTWSDVDFEERILSVRQVATQVSKKELRRGGKTDNAMRDMAVDEFTAGILAAQREYVAELRRVRPALNEKLAEKGRPPLPWADLDLVFCTSLGTILDRGTLRRHVDAIQAAAGVTRIKLYATRSTHGSVLADEGVNLHALAERMGQIDRTYLAKKYLKGSSSKHRALADMVGGILEAAARCNSDADAPAKPVDKAAESASRAGAKGSHTTPGAPLSAN